MNQEAIADDTVRITRERLADLERAESLARHHAAVATGLRARVRELEELLDGDVSARTEWAAHRADKPTGDPEEFTPGSEVAVHHWVDNPTDPADRVVQRTVVTITHPWEAVSATESADQPDGYHADGSGR